MVGGAKEEGLGAMVVVLVGDLAPPLLFRINLGKESLLSVLRVYEVVCWSGIKPDVNCKRGEWAVMVLSSCSLCEWRFMSSRAALLAVDPCELPDRIWGAGLLLIKASMSVS